MKISGIVIPFDRYKKQQLINGTFFYEAFDKHAFDNVNFEKVELINNFDESKPLAKATNGTLSVEITDKGLFAKATIDERSLNEDILKLLNGGWKFGYAFSVKEDYQQERNGNIYRTIKKVDKLFFISIYASKGNETDKIDP